MSCYEHSEAGLITVKCALTAAYFFLSLLCFLYDILNILVFLFSMQMQLLRILHVTFNDSHDCKQSRTNGPPNQYNNKNVFR